MNPGDGRRICKECGRTIFGSAVHYCREKEKSIRNKNMKDCNTCGHFNKITGCYKDECNGCLFLSQVPSYKNWIPGEQPTSVNMKMPEKRLRFLIEGFGLDDLQKNSIVLSFKEYGYILKSAVEEAEEMLKDEIEKTDYQYRIDNCRVILQAIQELKAENERLKK